jgi:methyltransferase
VTLSILILAGVTLQRLGELALARRNTRRLLARGAVEVGQKHYPLIVGLHAGWLAVLWALGWNRPIELGWLGAYCALQALRVWTLASLGERWTTRIMIVPGEQLVRRGPYRWVTHPNYLVVAGEIAVLPMVFQLPGIAVAASLLNASILWVRIRAEEAGLRSGAGL